VLVLASRWFGFITFLFILFSFGTGNRFLTLLKIKVLCWHLYGSMNNFLNNKNVWTLFPFHKRCFIVEKHSSDCKNVLLIMKNMFLVTERLF